MAKDTRPPEDRTRDNQKAIEFYAEETYTDVDVYQRAIVYNTAIIADQLCMITTMMIEDRLKALHGTI